MKSGVAWLISRALSDYVESIKPDELEIAFRKLQVKLANLKIKKDVLIKNNIPCQINRGIIGSIDLKISGLLSLVPAVFNVSDILIISSLKPKSALDFAKSFQTIDLSEIDKLCIKENVTKKDLLEGTLGSLLNGLTGRISNVHIRIEFIQNGVQMAGGIIIRNVILEDTDKGCDLQAEVFQKILKIEALSVYLDSNVEKMNLSIEINEYKKAMIEGFNNHSFILKDFTFCGKLEHNRSTGSNRIFVDTPGFDLSLNTVQYNGILRINQDRTRMQKLLYYTPCGRPDNENELSWIRYVHKAAYKKKNPLTVHLRDVKEFFEKKSDENLMAKIRLMIESPSKERKLIKDEILQIIEPEMLIRLSVYARRKLLIEKKQTIMESTNENFDAVTNDIQQNIGQLQKQDFEIELKAKQISASLIDETPIALFNIAGITGSSTFNHERIQAKVSIGDIDVIDPSTGKGIIHMLREEKSIVLELDLDQVSRITNIKGNIVEPVVQANIDFFMGISQFTKSRFQGIDFDAGVDPNTSNAKQYQKSQLYLSHLLDTKYKLNLDVTIGSPSITFPLEKEAVLKVGSMHIKTIDGPQPNLQDPKSLYDRFELSCRDFMMSCGGEQILEPISTTIKVYHRFVPIPNITSLIIDLSMNAAKFNLKRSQFKNLLQLSELYHLPTKDNPSPTTNPRKKNIQTSSDMSFDLKFYFEEASAKLLEEDGMIIDSFVIDATRAEVSFMNWKLNANFNIQRFIAVQGSDRTFCSFGDKITKAIDISVFHEGIKTNIKVNSDSPTILVDAFWIAEIQQFFIIEDSSPKQEEALKPIETAQQNESFMQGIKKRKDDISLELSVTTPKLIVPFPKIGSNDLIELSFGLDSVCINALLKEVEKTAVLSVNGMYLDIGKRHILDPMTTKLSFDFTNDLLMEGGLPVIQIFLENDDLLLAQEMLTYAKVQISNILGKKETKQAEATEPQKPFVLPKISTFVEGVNLTINEDEISRFKGSFDRINIDIDERSLFAFKGMQILEQITSETLHPFFSIDEEFSVSMDDEIQIDIKRIDDIEVSPMVAQWLVKIIKDPDYKDQIKIPIDKYPNSAQTEEKQIQKEEEVRSSKIIANVGCIKGLLKTETEDIATFEISPVSLRSDKLLEFSFDTLSVKAPSLGEYSDIIMVSKVSASQVNNSFEVKYDTVEVKYHFRYIFKKLLPFISTLLPSNPEVKVEEGNEEKDGPVVLPSHILKLDGNMINLVVINNDLKGSSVLSIPKISFTNAEKQNIYELRIPSITIKRSDFPSILDIGGLKLDIVCEVSNQPKEETNTNLIIRNVDINLNIDKIMFDFEQKAITDLLLGLNIYGLIPYFQSNESMLYGFGINISLPRISLIIEGERPLGISLQNLFYSYSSNGQSVNLGKISLSNKGKEEFFTLGNDQMNGIELSDKDEVLNCIINSPHGLVDIKTIVSAYEVLANFSLPFDEDQEEEKEDKVDKAVQKDPTKLNLMVNDIFVEILANDGEPFRGYMKGSVNLVKEHNIEFNAVNMCLGFSDGKDYRNHIIKDINFSFYINELKGTKTITILFSDIPITLSTIDISAAIMLFDNLTKSFPLIYSIEEEINVTEAVNKLYFGVSIRSFDLNLAFAAKDTNGYYRQTIHFRASAFNITHSAGTYIASTMIDDFSYLNPSTRQWDTLIDPVKLNLTLQEDKVKINTEAINVNLTLSITGVFNRLLKEITDIHEDGKLIPHIKDLPYYLLNKTNEPITFKKKIISPNSKFHIKGIDDQSTFEIMLHGHVFSISMGDLFYPYYLFSGTVCYFIALGDSRQVVISPSIFIKTKISGIVLMTRNPESTCNLNKSTALPFDISNKTLFHICNEDNKKFKKRECFSYSQLRKGTFKIHTSWKKHSIIVVPKYNPNTGVLCVVLHKRYSIQNDLPESLMFRKNEEKAFTEIRPYSRLQANIDKSSELSFYLKSVGPDSLRTIDFEKDKSKIPLKLRMPYGKVYFIIENSYNDVTMIRTLRIYAPAIVYNMSPFSFLLSNQDGISFGKITKEPIYMSAKNYHEDGNLVVNPSITGTPEEGVDIGAISRIVLPRFNSLNDASLPLKGVVTHVTNAPSTHIISFFALLVISNELNQDIYLKALRDDDIIKTFVRKDTKAVLPFCCKDGKFYVSLDAENYVEMSIHNKERRSYLFKNGEEILSIEVSFNNEGCETVMHVKKCGYLAPLMIDNELDQNISLFGSEFIAHSLKALHEAMPTSLSFGGTEVTLNSTAGTETKYGLIFAKLKILNGGSKVIEITQKTPRAITRRTSLRIAVKKLSVSLINAYCRETALLTLSGITLKMTPNQQSMLLDASISSIQLDDMHIGAELPVAVTIQQAPALRASAEVLFSGNLLSKLDLKVSPIQCYIDLKFVNDLFEMTRGKIDSVKEPKNPITPANILPSYSKFAIDNLTISGISILTSFRGDSSRPAEFPFRNSIVRVISNIPDLDRFSLSFMPVSIENLTTDADDLSKRLITPYKNQIPSIASLAGEFIGALAAKTDIDLKRSRLPRAILGRRVTNYDERVAKMQWDLFKKKKIAIDLIVCRNEWKYLMTDQEVIILNNGKIVNEINISDISDVNCDGNVVRFMASGPIRLHTLNKTDAEIVFMYIHSHSFSSFI